MKQLALSDQQLRQITAIAVALPVEKRSLLLQRIAAYCQMRGLFHADDREVDAALHSTAP